MANVCVLYDIHPLNTKMNTCAELTRTSTCARICVLFFYCKCDVCVICLHPLKCWMICYRRWAQAMNDLTSGFKQKYRIIYAIITQPSRV